MRRTIIPLQMSKGEIVRPGMVLQNTDGRGQKFYLVLECKSYIVYTACWRQYSVHLPGSGRLQYHNFFIDDSFFECARRVA